MSTPTKPTPTKPELFLTGPRTGGPTPEDIFALFRKLTGREPSPEEMAEIRADYARMVAEKTP